MQRGGDMDALSREDFDRLCVRNLLAARHERVFFKDLEGRFLLVSAGWLEAEGQGRTLESVIGKTDFDIFSGPHAIAAHEDEQRVIQTGEPMVGKIERETFDDREDVWVSTTKFPLIGDDGSIVGTFGVARDVTAQMHDALTGVSNRVALIDRLTQALVALERRPSQLGVLFLDIDNFKHVNDEFGHSAGDRVLIEIGRRLTSVSRRFDTVARYGGDEFAILCTSLNDNRDLRLIARRVLAVISEPVIDGENTHTITTSLGAVITRDPAADPDALLQQADAAMYAAKRAGPGRIRIQRAARARALPAIAGQ
jgi:diguanylate cyclase (GGDEF)-like protein/PAS domain S-box-containing protein